MCYNDKLQDKRWNLKNFVTIIFTIYTTLFGASFNCSNAVTKIEKTICQDQNLSKLDTRLSNIYKKVLKLSKQNRISKYEANSIYHLFKQTQRKWIKQRDKRCSKTPQIKECLKSYYDSRIKKLEDFSLDESFVYRNFKNVLYLYTHKPYLYDEFKKVLNKKAYKHIKKELLGWQKFYDVCKNRFGVINDECAKKIAKEKTIYYQNLLSYFKNHKKIGSKILKRVSFSYRQNRTCYIYNFYPKKELQKLFYTDLSFDNVEKIPQIKNYQPCKKENTPYTEKINEKIIYTNPNIVVLQRKKYEYTGGLHGDEEMTYFTFDRHSGKKINLKKILLEKRDILSDFVVKNMKNIVVFEKYNSYSDRQFYDLAVNKGKFYLNQKGLTIFFSTYEIAPYSDSKPSFTISKKILKQALSKKQFRYYFIK